MYTVLVIEREPEFVPTWRHLLEQRGFRFLVTGDEHVALAFSLQTKPHVVLSDGNVLQRTGVEKRLIEELRNASPGVLIFALWPGWDAGRSLKDFCPESDYNVQLRNNFAVLLRMLDSALDRQGRRAVLATGS